MPWIGQPLHDPAKMHYFQTGVQSGFYVDQNQAKLDLTSAGGSGRPLGRAALPPRIHSNSQMVRECGHFGKNCATKFQKQREERWRREKAKQQGRQSGRQSSHWEGGMEAAQVDLRGVEETDAEEEEDQRKKKEAALAATIPDSFMRCVAQWEKDVAAHPPPWLRTEYMAKRTLTMGEELCPWPAQIRTPWPNQNGAAPQIVAAAGG